ncbi:MAG TPA: hydantoinase/oxoprolinase family protein, partial [Microbacterium sp.]|nr:hydantoinase/oxoprolinase family protein [Microbacterium sp.]
MAWGSRSRDTHPRAFRNRVRDAKRTGEAPALWSRGWPRRPGRGSIRDRGRWRNPAAAAEGSESPTGGGGDTGVDHLGRRRAGRSLGAGPGARRGGRRRRPRFRARRVGTLRGGGPVVSEHCVISADIGGTFTDVVLTRGDGRMHVAKQLTTPEAPEESVLEGVRRVLDEANVPASSIVRVVHGTTLAANAVIERKGARVAFVTTEGFGDLLRIGREARVEDDRYDLHFDPALPPLRRESIFEVRERMNARGEVIEPFDETGAREVALQISKREPEAIAICFLHSYANADHEERMEILLREIVPSARVIPSSRVHPEMREFDRASTTLFTAEVAPLMARYLAKLGEGLSGMGIDAPLQIMESSGGVMAASVAAERAVALRTLVSAMRADGLGMSWIHFRVNAKQLHNAIRTRLGDAADIDLSSRGAIAALRELLAGVEPQSANFASLAVESSTA